MNIILVFFMYKLYHNLFPPLFDMFERTSNIHKYPTRQLNSYHIRLVPTVRPKEHYRNNWIQDLEHYK